MTIVEPLRDARVLGRVLEPRWGNWLGSLVLFLAGMPLAVALLPPAASFWVSAGLALLLCTSLVVNAWGRYTGGLLVAPAIALLFIMNIFPLLWSLGLSFFSYRANRAKPPIWAGLDNYAKVLNDPDVWDRLHNTAILGHLHSDCANDRRLPAGAAVRQTVSAAAISPDPRSRHR